MGSRSGGLSRTIVPVYGGQRGAKTKNALNGPRSVVILGLRFGFSTFAQGNMGSLGQKGALVCKDFLRRPFTRPAFWLKGWPGRSQQRKPPRLREEAPPQQRYPYKIRPPFGHACSPLAMPALFLACTPPLGLARPLPGPRFVAHARPLRGLRLAARACPPHGLRPSFPQTPKSPRGETPGAA